jgi:polyisoprenoid-binding protein YceI
LTIKGVGREIAAPFTLRQEGQDWTADGRFDIKRLDFNIGDGPWADTYTVANEVQIRFKFRLRPQP